MYTYLLNSNSKSQPSEQLISRIDTELKRLHIDGKIMRFEGEQQLYTQLTEIDKSSTNTLVLLGDDVDFELFVGQAGKIKEDLALGYIPVAESEIAQKLNIKDWLTASEALAKRKIKEINVYSVANRYFLTKLNFSLSEGSKLRLPIQIISDGNLKLSLPSCELSIDNDGEEDFQNSKPLTLTACRHNNQKVTSAEANIFGFIKKQLKADTATSEQILHLPIKAAKISFDGQAIDNLGRTYSKSILIGKHHRKLRLITSKAAIK